MHAAGRPPPVRWDERQDLSLERGKGILPVSEPLYVLEARVTPGLERGAVILRQPVTTASRRAIPN